MKTIEIEIDGERIKVVAEKLNGKLWLHYNGNTVVHEPAQKLQAGGAQAHTQDPTQIFAPMPGKIVKIHKMIGAQVKSGETVVAMEAMKMEYNLKATKNMVIKEILCQENQIVALGAKLIVMEEISE